MIRSRDNAKVKDMRRLRRCKGDRALLEGPHLVGDAAAAGVPLEVVLAAPDFLVSEAGRELVARLPREPLEVERRLLDGLCDTDSPRGVLAAARLPRGGVATLPRRPGVYLFLDGVQDPGNLGAIARSAEAAGAVALALAPGSAHPNHPRALRASAGSLLRLPAAVETTAAELARHLAPASPTWLALTPRGGRDLAQVPAEGTLVLAVGAEGQGLSAELAAAVAPLPVSIPLAGQVESLNAAVAVAVALFDLARRRSAERV
ncbi:MAG: RNA methyltransferase [Thermoanaerobaculia bacterium]|nr:RNA methyltransferase [Thermoanaerobaculia bacterium]